MIFVTFSNLWSLVYFFFFTYITFVFCTITYCLPTLTNKNSFSVAKNNSSFKFINSFDLTWVFIAPVLVLTLTQLLWSGPSISAWFGHLIFAGTQLKMTYLISFTYVGVLITLISTSYFSSREIYDFIITIFNFFYWTVLLFMSNSIFTSIFIIEVLSTLIFLLIITSTFSTTFFYRNINFAHGHLFQQSTPQTYLQSILFFFWVSLVSSLNLFLFCLFFYLKVLTLDWFLIEYVFVYLTTVSSLKDLIFVGMSWFILMFCLFLKCGIAPLYIWKPTFFKGIPFHTIFFYICFFYFFLFLFVIHLLTSYFAEVFYFYSYIVTTFLLLGLITLLFIVCDSYYFKSFLAVSSILNSLFVFIALSSTHNTSLVLWM
jgi:hypothetical protein